MANKGKAIQPEYVSVETAEIMTDRSRWSWRKDAYSGRIASCKIGRRLLLPLSEVQRIMAEGFRPRASTVKQ
jgi:hypothetical protein